MASSTLATLVNAVVALAVIAAASVLLALGKIDGQTAIALFGVAVALIGGSTNALLALHVPPPRTPAPAPPPAAGP